jgi:hypothetical protein
LNFCTIPGIPLAFSRIHTEDDLSREAAGASSSPLVPLKQHEKQREEERRRCVREDWRSNWGSPPIGEEGLEEALFFGESERKWKEHWSSGFQG